MKVVILDIKKYIQGVSILWLITALLVTALPAPSLFGAAAQPELTDKKLEPLSRKFLEFKKEHTPGNPLNYSPPPVSHSHVRGTLENIVNTTDYPSRLDLRENDRVSPVKDQENYFFCWVFAAYTSLESCLLPEEVVDFSEWHLALNHGFDDNLNGGGNSYMSTAYLIRWSGPIDESIAPYGTANHEGKIYSPAKHVQQVIFLPDREDPLDNNTIKYHLMNYGPIDFAFYWNVTGFKDAANSFYIPGNTGQNHRLAMVGWDDDYPASNFTYTPPGNGAFIARNSWGESWGARGYCYISYYDMSLQEMMSFNSAETPINYGSIYQYDPLGRTRGWGDDIAWGANVFTAEDPQPLEAVGFYSYDANMMYEIYIYNHISGDSPTNGTLAAVKTGQFVYPGYYTVKLDNPVPLTQGARFSVVVKFINSNHRYAVPIEYPVSGHNSYATALPGQSFISEDGLQWIDLTEKWENSNVCIKAYAKYRKSLLHLDAVRRTVSAWVVVRQFGQITVTLENPENAELDKLILYRSIDGIDFQSIYETNIDELHNNTFTFQDKYLDTETRYIYTAKAFDADGLVNSKSEPATI